MSLQILSCFIHYHVVTVTPIKSSSEMSLANRETLHSTVLLFSNPHGVFFSMRQHALTCYLLHICSPFFPCNAANQRMTGKGRRIDWESHVHTQRVTRLLCSFSYHALLCLTLTLVIIYTETHIHIWGTTVYIFAWLSKKSKSYSTNNAVIRFYAEATYSLWFSIGNYYD